MKNVIKVNFNMGGMRIDQGFVDLENFEDINEMLNEDLQFVDIQNEYGDWCTYNKNKIVWIVKVRD